MRDITAERGAESGGTGPYCLRAFTALSSVAAAFLWQPHSLIALNEPCVRASIEQPRVAGVRHLRQEPSFSPSSPETFGPFRVLHQIGAGTLGPVFRAHDPTSGRLVALKVFELSLEPERAAALAVELSHLVEKGLTHSAVTAPVGAGLKGTTPYLASEYVAGESLDVVARRGRTAASGDVPWIIRRVAEAIDFGAGESAEHGLLHPRDVLVTDSDARVTGLGVGRALERVGIPLPVRRPYSAPERIEGARWTYAADVYALGVMAYELLLNKRFAGEAGELTIHPDELPGMDVEAVGDVLSRSLAVQPEKRHQTGRAFVRDLEAALSGTPKKTASLPLLDSIDGPAPEPSPWERSAPLPSDALQEAEDAGSIPLSAAERDQPPLRMGFEDEQSVTEGQSVMFGGHDSDRPSRRRSLGILIGVLLVAATAVAGYLAVVGSGWWTAEQSSGETPFTETTVNPPVESPAAPPPETSAQPTPPAPTPPRPAPAAAAPTPAAPATRETPAPAKAPAKVATTPDAPAKATSVVATGRMLIRSTPAGAQVAVNGVASGVTPLVLRNLPFGSYTIRLTLSGHVPSDHSVVLNAQHEAQSLEVTLQEGQGAPISQGAGAAAPTGRGAPIAAKLGSLSIESRPAGATVFFNNQRLGQTPLALNDLPAGPGTVRLELEGYRSWSSTVAVTAGTRSRVAASLERATTR
jgi:serine/threonine-protein kinase